jgi:hypothetical protein
VTLIGPSSLSLPKATALTDLLTAPADGEAATLERNDVRTCLQARIDGIDPAQVRTGLRIDGRIVHRALACVSPSGDRAFTWNARTAARALGSTALRASGADGPLAPAQAVVDSVRLRIEHHRGAHGDRSLDRWLSKLPSGARRAVLAEALTWTTAVRSALDWELIGPDADVGGPDAWWNSRPPRRVGVRARAEVRVPVRIVPAEGVEHAEPVGLALFVVLPGWPGPSSPAELGVTALAHLLAPSVPLPVVRVVGWWPRTGAALAVVVDRAVVAGAIDTVGSAVAWAGCG